MLGFWVKLLRKDYRHHGKTFWEPKFTSVCYNFWSRMLVKCKEISRCYNDKIIFICKQQYTLQCATEWHISISFLQRWNLNKCSNGFSSKLWLNKGMPPFSPERCRDVHKFVLDWKIPTSIFLYSCKPNFQHSWVMDGWSHCWNKDAWLDVDKLMWLCGNELLWWWRWLPLPSV